MKIKNWIALIVFVVLTVLNFTIIQSNNFYRANKEICILLIAIVSVVCLVNIFPKKMKSIFFQIFFPAFYFLFIVINGIFFTKNDSDISTENIAYSTAYITYKFTLKPKNLIGDSKYFINITYQNEGKDYNEVISILSSIEYDSLQINDKIPVKFDKSNPDAVFYSPFDFSLTDFTNLIGKNDSIITDFLFSKTLKNWKFSKNDSVTEWSWNNYNIFVKNNSIVIKDFGSYEKVLSDSKKYIDRTEEQYKNNPIAKKIYENEQFLFNVSYETIREDNGYTRFVPIVFIMAKN